MTTVFIAGSISIKHLNEMVQARIDKIVSSEFDIVVGDANGADAAIQECLQRHGARKVTVYCTGAVPRNNVAGWPVYRVVSKARAGSRAYYTAKDLEMARASDYGLMIWDCKSTGTLSNVIELLREKKKSVVFVNKRREFVTVSGQSGLEHLLTFMSEHARAKAEKKIGVSQKMASMSQGHLSLDTVLADPEQSADVGRATSASQTSARSESMKLRTSLMSALKDYIVYAQLTQSQAAEVFGVTQPRISDLTRGKVDLFGLDALVNMAASVGLRVEMRIAPAAK